MPRGRRSFKRALGERGYRKMYVIAVEGVKTEPQYFALLDDLQVVVRVTFIQPGRLRIDALANQSKNS